jgi:tetratricopeptide (TPR) repeat protein
MTDSAIRQNWDGAAIGALAEALARLFVSGQDAKRIVADAELEKLLPLLEFDGGASVVWWRILNAASIRPGAVESVLGVALKEYPNDPALTRAVSLAKRREAVARAAPPESVTVSVRPDADARPLVDREEIVGKLNAELERVNAGRGGQALVLKGDSGVGKTRLADCAARAARERGAVVLEAQCLDASSGPLFSLRDSLKFYRGDPTIEEVLRATPGRQDYTRFLGSILEIDDVGTAGPRLGGSTAEGVFAGLAEVLLGLAADRGLCLVVEDLTEADRDTLLFLDYFRRKAAPERVLTLSTVKQDLVDSELQERIDKWEGEGCRVVTVLPLEPDDAAELVSCVWQGPKLGEEQVARIVRITGGNPYFIVQYLELMRDDASFDAEANVPGGIKAVLRRRLRRLDDDVRGFLDAASVALEANDRLDVLVHVAGVDARNGAHLLRRAVEARCLAEDVKGGVKFAQELLRRLVYDGIDRQSRCAMHASAAALLEEAGLFTSAAHHYQRAAREDDVLRTAREAADRAAHAGLYSTAVQFYELALSIGDLKTIGPLLARAYLVVGEWRQAEELLARLPGESPEVRLLRSELLFVRGSFDRAREEIELALQAPSADRLKTLVRLADIDLYLGELPSAAEHAREALAVADTDTDRARGTGIVGAAAFFAGDVEEGERRFIEAMTVVSSQAPEERDPVVYTTLLGNLASVAEARGHWDEAKQSHEEALAKRREVSDARGVLQSLHAVGRTELALEGFDRALPQLEEARAMAAELGDELECGKIENTFVDVELRRGDPSAAVRRAEAALKRFRAANTAYDVTHGRFSLARALGASGEHRKAVEEAAAARVAMTCAACVDSSTAAAVRLASTDPPGRPSRLDSRADVALYLTRSLASSSLAVASSSFARASRAFCGTCWSDVQSPIPTPPSRTTIPMTKQIHATASACVTATIRSTAGTLLPHAARGFNPR